MWKKFSESNCCGRFGYPGRNNNSFALVSGGQNDGYCLRATKVVLLFRISTSGSTEKSIICVLKYNEETNPISIVDQTTRTICLRWSIANDL